MNRQNVSNNYSEFISPDWLKAEHLTGVCFEIYYIERLCCFIKLYANFHEKIHKVFVWWSEKQPKLELVEVRDHLEIVSSGGEWILNLRG